MIVCVVCSTAFPAPRRAGARPTMCSSECRAEAGRRRAAAWHAEHRDDPSHKAVQARAARRAYERRLADPEKVERHRQLTAAWRARNREALLAYEREYREANREAVREKNRRRRARLLDAWVEDVDVEAIWIRDGGVCGVCGEPIDLTLAWPDRGFLTLDHIVPLARDGEHSMANCQIAHMACNARKNDRVAA